MLSISFLMKILILIFIFMKKLFYVLIIAIIAISCEMQIPFTTTEPVASSGVVKAQAVVQTDADGHTVEQKNVLERYHRDNIPGSIKHLYIISGISGQVLIYSTVKGKVTSSSKRLTPSTVVGDGRSETRYHFNFIEIAGRSYLTNEVLGDDGTYGSSSEYLYWFDSKNVYHQHFRGADEMLHISDQPLNVKSVILNLETL